MARDCIDALCPLLGEALRDSDVVNRRKAYTAIKDIALNMQGSGCEDALEHIMLNHIWPHIFETTPRYEHAFLEALQAMTVALGPGKILQYVLQGMFHPARKVRDVYWKIYNTLYIQSQDELVAAYPRIENDPKNNYIRHELDYML